MLRQSLTGFRQGDHVCVLYDTVEERTRVAAAFIADGLRRGERCIHAAGDADALQLFRARLTADGIDVAYEEERRSLILVTKERAHLTGGKFDPARILDGLNDAVEASVEDGYVGLRTCGDMSWLLDRAPGSAQVVEYEALCTRFFRNVRALGMCQYDRTRIAPPELNGALATHPSVFIDGRHRANPFHDAAGHGRFRDDSAAAFDAKYAQLRS